MPGQPLTHANLARLNEKNGNQAAAAEVRARAEDERIDAARMREARAAQRRATNQTRRDTHGTHRRSSQTQRHLEYPPLAPRKPLNDDKGGPSRRSSGVQR